MKVVNGAGSCWLTVDSFEQDWWRKVVSDQGFSGQWSIGEEESLFLSKAFGGQKFVPSYQLPSALAGGYK